MSLIKRPPQLLIPLEVEPTESSKIVRSVIPMEGDPRKALHAGQGTVGPSESEATLEKTESREHRISEADKKGRKNSVKKRVTFDVPE